MSTPSLLTPDVVRAALFAYLVGRADTEGRTFVDVVHVSDGIEIWDMTSGDVLWGLPGTLADLPVIMAEIGIDHWVTVQDIESDLDAMMRAAGFTEAVAA